MTEYAVENRIYLCRKKYACLGRRSRPCLCVSSITRGQFIAQGHTLNQQCYLDVLTRLRESVRRKRPGLWPDKWILHHDSAPAHDTLRVRENSITKIDHSPYSSDLAPCDFWLFPKLKKCPGGTKICC
jgi:hypothetical protein